MGRCKVIAREVSFDAIVECLVQTRDRLKYVEKELIERTRQRDAYFDELHPDLARRRRQAELDGEIRLLREQG